MAKYHKNLKYHDDNINKHDITDEELLFLHELQKELNTQDTVSQANPRFWVIKGTEKLYHVEEADGYELYDSECCDILADTTEGICDYINSNLLEEDEMIEELEDLQEINDWLEERGYDYQVISYKIIPKIYENTMFLTQIDAENHLRSNYYNYSDDAHTYAMTAWRDPRMDKLIKILQKVKWE